MRAIARESNPALAKLNYFRYSADMRVIERPFSDLLRHPKEVTRDVAESDVLLRRRGEPDLRLSRADREDERASAVVVFGRALRNIAAHSPEALAQALADEFGWISFLPVKERQEFIDEFTRTVLGAAEIDNFAPLMQLMHEWRATAEVFADPKLSRRLRRSITAQGSLVPDPSA